MATQQLQQAAPGFEYVVVDTSTGSSLIQVRQGSGAGVGKTSRSQKGAGKTSGRSQKGSGSSKGQGKQQKGASSKAPSSKRGDGAPPQDSSEEQDISPASHGGEGSTRRARNLLANERITGLRQKKEDTVEVCAHGQEEELPRPAVLP